MSPRESAARQNLKPSPALAALLGGATPLDGTTAMKLTWQYVNKSGLWRLGYEKQIAVDDRLMAVLQYAGIKPRKPPHPGARLLSARRSGHARRRQSTRLPRPRSGLSTRKRCEGWVVWARICDVSGESDA